MKRSAFWLVVLFFSFSLCMAACQNGWMFSSIQDAAKSSYVDAGAVAENPDGFDKTWSGGKKVTIERFNMGMFLLQKDKPCKVENLSAGTFWSVDKPEIMEGLIKINQPYGFVLGGWFGTGASEMTDPLVPGVCTGDQLSALIGGVMGVLGDKPPSWIEIDIENEISTKYDKAYFDNLAKQIGIIQNTYKLGVGLSIPAYSKEHWYKLYEQTALPYFMEKYGLEIAYLTLMISNDYWGNMDFALDESLKRLKWPKDRTLIVFTNDLMTNQQMWYGEPNCQQLLDKVQNLKDAGYAGVQLYNLNILQTEIQEKAALLYAAIQEIWHGDAPSPEPYISLIVKDPQDSGSSFQVQKDALVYDFETGRWGTTATNSAYPAIMDSWSLNQLLPEGSTSFEAEQLNIKVSGEAYKCAGKSSFSLGKTYTVTLDPNGYKCSIEEYRFDPDKQ